jgi:hypothetical protein
MGFSFRNFFKGIRLVPNSANTTSSQGDLQSTTDTFVNYHNGTTSSPVVTISHANQGANRLQNKDLDDATIAIVDSSDTTKQIGFDAAGSSGTKTTIASSQTSNRTLTLPDATDTIVGVSIAQTLSNKSLVDNSTTIVDNSDATKQIKFDAGGTTGTSTTLVAVQTSNRVITLPDVTDTLVGLSASQTLTNKILTGNEIDNFKTNGGSATITAPTVTGTLATLAGTETLSNKTIALASNSITGTANQVVIMSGAGVETTEANLAISRGGTNAGTASAAFGNLSPLTTKGDTLVYGSANSRLPVGVNNQVLTADSTKTLGVKWANPGGATAPTIQTFTSPGTYTYTPTSASILYIKFRMAGAGGGGAGGGETSLVAGTSGGNTSFSTILTAQGGVGGPVSAGAQGGAGGGLVINAGATVIYSVNGGTGGGIGAYITGAPPMNEAGGPGGTNAFGGAGLGNANGNGGNAVANTGAGGAGGAGRTASNSYGGTGGGAGAYIEAMIVSPASSYSITVGSGGSGGTGNNAAGGAGGHGVILIEEYYQ